MIYFISFIEALATGLTSINLALYLKFVLKLSELDAAKIISAFGIISSILIFLCGPLIDRFGLKRCAIVGASLLTLGRLLLGSTNSVTLTVLCLFLMSLGSAVKSGAVVVFLKKYNKSFKLDYVIFNMAYCIAGILYDTLHSYSLAYTISGLLTVLNVAVLFMLPKDEEKTEKTEKKVLNMDTFKTVLFYNFIMMPVTCVFTFMANFIPKSALHIIGPDAPVGKLYGSLNPFIILLTVPLFAYLNNKFKLSAYYSAILGTLLSAISLLFIMFPGTYLYLVLTSIVVFTIGEAIWSPASMEVAARICPTGEEGKYMTLSLVPRTLGNIFMSYFLSYSFTHYIYVTPVNFKMPFLVMGLFAALTPISLFFGKRMITRLS